eukprot:114777-Amphidinium_carterae.2
MRLATEVRNCSAWCASLPVAADNARKDKSVLTQLGASPVYIDPQQSEGLWCILRRSSSSQRQCAPLHWSLDCCPTELEEDLPSLWGLGELRNAVMSTRHTAGRRIPTFGQAWIPMTT